MTDQPDDTTTKPDTPSPADRRADPPAGSPLLGIREAAEQVPVDDVEDYVDLVVPRWQSQLAVAVRYHRIDHRKARNILDVPEKKRRQDPHGWDLAAAIRLLIEACGGIFVSHTDGNDYAFNEDAPTGVWPTFDDVDVIRAQLSKKLRIDTPADAVKGLYMADPDIITVSGRYSELMGYDLGGDLERIQGN